MSETDNHIDEIRAGIKDIVNHPMFYNDSVDNGGDEPVVVGKAGIEALVSFVDQYYADFYRDKIPSKQSVPKGDLTSVGLQIRFRALGYNQAIDDMHAQFNSKGDNDE